MNIAVYLASSDGVSPELREKARELGEWIAKNGHTLVYGGSDCGLMGVIARSCMNANGKVIGVEPQYYIDMGFAFAWNEITELIVTKTMAERRAKMIELSDAFVAFPGGTGTLEEVAEVMSHVMLPNTPEYIDGPCILYSINGYWDGLKTVLNNMLEAGFSTKEKQKQVYFCETLEEVTGLLQNK